jgi:predicted GNAT family acetyltransferase
VSFIQHFLKIYLLGCRTNEEVKQLLTTLLFWDLSDEHQIGFARVKLIMLFLHMDGCFITENHRGKGYSSVLIDAMMKSKLQQVKIGD